jgi:hypothetical protein
LVSHTTESVPTLANDLIEWLSLHLACRLPQDRGVEQPKQREPPWLVIR